MRVKRVLTRLAIAVLMGLLFVILGLSEGLGYSVSRLDQVSFVTHDQLGYADAVIDFSATYDPLLYPFYYIKGAGYVNGTFSLIYIPESYGPGEFGGARWGLKPSDRYETYTIQMITWGFLPNLVILLFVSVLIEVAKARALYITMFIGILGFYTASLIGMLIGLIVGVAVGLFIMFRLPKDNIVIRFWNSIWQ
jgi:hypothetical protein